MNKEIAIGMVVALIATVTGFFGYAEFVSDLGFDETVEFIIKGKLYGKVITLAAIPNLFVFFVFLKKKQDYRARGVLIFTIILAIIVSVLKFI